MKKVTFITRQLKTPGGIERFISTLSDILSKNFNVEIIVNYGKPSEPLAFPIGNNVQLTFLSPIQPKEVSMKNLVFDFKWHKIPGEIRRRQKINSEQKRAFKKHLGDLNTNYIITDRARYNNLVKNYYSGNAKKIATDHNFHQNDRKYIRKLLNSLKTFDFLIVATEELKKFYTPKLKKTKCLKIPNPLEKIPAEKSNLTKKNLISVGRLVPEKDFITLIEIMKKISKKDPEIHLNIIGDGIEKHKIIEKIKSEQLENNVHLLGFLPQKNIQKYYYESSLFVMTSKTEAFGLVLTEAMSYGLPCLALNRASGARAQLDSQNLMKNPDEMAKKIISLLNDRKSLLKLQRSALNNIKRYSPQEISKKWQEVVH